MPTPYVRDQDTVDGIVNYESILLSLNAGGTLHEPLVLIYPKEGIVTADYPFMLLNAAKRDAYDKVTAYLRTPDVQKRIMTDTLAPAGDPGRAARPAVHDPDPDRAAVPGQARHDRCADHAPTSTRSAGRRPPSSSSTCRGRWHGERLDRPQGHDEGADRHGYELTGQFSRFRAHEQVTIITFSTQVEDVREFTIDDVNPDGPDMTAIRDYIDALADATTARRSTPRLAAGL